MGRNDHLKLPRWALIARGRIPRFSACFFEKTQGCRLELRMEVGFGLLHQKERKVGVAYLF